MSSVAVAPVLGSLSGNLPEAIDDRLENEAPLVVSEDHEEGNCPTPTSRFGDISVASCVG